MESTDAHDTANCVSIPRRALAALPIHTPLPISDELYQIGGERALPFAHKAPMSVGIVAQQAPRT